MAYQSVAIGVLLEGVNFNTDDSSAMFFLQGDAVNLTAIASLTNVTKASLIPLKKDAVNGFGWSSNPRNPITEGSPTTVKLVDQQNRLGPIFAEDDGDVVTRVWELADNFVERDQVDFRIYGTSAPSAGDFFLYLESECVQVESVTPGADGLSYDITVTRGVRGSVAKPHQFRPKNVPANEEGDYQALYFYDRIDWDHEKIPATIYQLNLEGNTAVSVRTMCFGVVTARPRPNGHTWVVTIEAATKSILAHKFGGGRPEVPISHCLQVTQVSLGSGYGPSSGGVTNPDALVTTVASDDVEGQQPKAAGVRLTREEAEYLLGENLHISTSQWVDPDRVTALAARMAPGINQTKPFQYQIVVEAGGWSGAFDLKKIESEQSSYFPSTSTITADDVGAVTMVKLTLQLAETFEGSISSAPVGVSADGFLTGERLDGLNTGWSSADGEPIAPGEEGPKLSLRLVMKADFFTACLYLFASDLGDETNPGAEEFDVLACGFGMGYDMRRLNVGSFPSNPISPDPGTTEFCELAVMLPELFDYVFTVGGGNGQFGPWLKNEGLRCMCLWASELDTGLMGWRQEDRPSSAITTLNAVKGSVGIVQPGVRLKAVDSIRILIGFEGKNLEPADYRIIRLKNKDTADLVDAEPQEVRFWRRGKWSAESLNAGAVPRLTSFYFRQLRGSPSIFKVPASVISGARMIGDFVRFTDPTIQTASGRGLTNKVCQVVATDNDYSTGIYWLVLLPHALSVINSSEGNEAPVLKIYHVEEEVAGSQYWLWVDALGTEERVGFDVETAFQGIYGILATGSTTTRVRIVTPARQNPFGTLERAGWLEAYGRITDLKFNGVVSKILIVIDPAWNRSATVDFRADLLLTDRSYILFTDRRKAVANVEGIEIVPRTETREDGDLPLSSYAPGGGAVPYDQHFYTFIS